MTRHAPALACLWLLTTTAAAAENPAPPPKTAVDESQPASIRVKELLGMAGKGEPAIVAFRASLRDSRAPVRAAAVQLLAREAGPAATEAIGGMIADPDESVGVAAAAALVAVPGEAPLGYLRQALKSPSSRLRSQTLSYLGDAKDNRLVPEIASLVSDPDPNLRRTAIETLEAIGAPDAFPVLMQATADAAPGVVAVAVRALAGLGDPRALPRVAALAGAPSVATRMQVALAIPALGGLTTQSAAVETLEKDAQKEVRRALVLALRDHPTPEGMPILRRRATDADASVRRAVAQALKVNPDPSASEAITVLLQDKAAEVRATGLLALAARKASDRIGAMTPLAADPATTVRSTLATALGELAVPEGIPTLKQLVTDKAVEVRATAAGGAGNIPSAKSLEVLDIAIKDPDAYVRSMAVRGLGALRVDGALRRLRTALSAEKDPAVRVLVIQQLEARADREALPELRKLAQSQTESTRAAASRAIRAIEASGTAAPTVKP